MTLSEFKAWLEGYSCSFDTHPREVHWKLILEKLETVDKYKYNTREAYVSPSVVANHPLGHSTC